MQPRTTCYCLLLHVLGVLSGVIQGNLLSLRPAGQVPVSVGSLITFTCTTTASRELGSAFTITTSPLVDFDRGMIVQLSGGAREINLTVAVTSKHNNLKIVCTVSNATSLLEKELANLTVQGERTI